MVKKISFNGEGEDDRETGTAPDHPNLRILYIKMRPFFKRLQKKIGRDPDRPSPHLKHFVCMMRGTLRAKPDTKLDLKFDPEKAFNAAYIDLETQFSKEDNDYIIESQGRLLRFCRNAKNGCQKDGFVKKVTTFEKIIIGALMDLIPCFYEYSAEKFHTYKVGWLEELNTKLVPPVVEKKETDKVSTENLPILYDEGSPAYRQTTAVPELAELAA